MSKLDANKIESYVGLQGDSPRTICTDDMKIPDELMVISNAFDNCSGILNAICEWASIKYSDYEFIVIDDLICKLSIMINNKFYPQFTYEMFIHYHNLSDFIVAENPYHIHKNMSDLIRELSFEDFEYSEPTRHFTEFHSKVDSPNNMDKPMPRIENLI